MGPSEFSRGFFSGFAAAGFASSSLFFTTYCTMSAMGGPPEEIGRKVAAALVGTFLGIQP